MRLFILLALLGASKQVYSCATQSPQMTKVDFIKFQKKFQKNDQYTRKTASYSIIPTLPTNWGGNNKNGNRLEAIIANLSSINLNISWQRPNINDVLLSFPIKILQSNFHPYGDGQSNAMLSLASWTNGMPPIYATKVITSGQANIFIYLSTKLQIPSKKITVIEKNQSESISLIPFNSEYLVGTYLPKSNSAIWISPLGWNDGFAISFDSPVYSIENIKKMAGVSNLPDPENIKQEMAEKKSNAFTTLMNHRFLNSFNDIPYNPKNIHAEFPDMGKIATGVGQGWTWVADKPKMKFKTLYTCFEGRNLTAEENAKDGGVPTGGGWHEIGDPAETIINSLEPVAITVGLGMKNTLIPPKGNYAYGLSDNIIIRLLKPNEALMTSKNNFHWFIFDSNREVCTEEWVHNCIPNNSNSFGMKCN